MITQKRLSSQVINRNVYLEQLQKVPLFAHLSREELAELLRRMGIRRWRADAIIVGQNEPGDALYLLAAGQAKAVLFGENGREMTLSQFGCGDFFGEMSLLSGKPRSAHVIAVTDCVLLTLDGEAFKDHLRAHPETALQLLRTMAERLHRADEIINNLALHDVASRLTRTLIDIAQEQGEAHADGVLIRKRPTQQDLANRLGTCRETVSRTLSSMARRGLVVSRGRMLLLRPALIAEARQAA